MARRRRTTAGDMPRSIFYQVEEKPPRFSAAIAALAMPRFRQSGAGSAGAGKQNGTAIGDVPHHASTSRGARLRRFRGSPRSTR